MTPARRSAARWLLVGVVLIGILGLHFLSGHDSAGNHLVVRPALAALQTQPAGAVGGAVSNTAVGDGDLSGTVTATTRGDGHTIVAGCALLLLVGLGIALFLSMRRRSVGDRSPERWKALEGTLRGPPGTVNREVLCVERT